MKVLLPKSRKGLSLIEVLVLVAVSAVLLAFTTPVLRDHSARAEVKEATVQVALALHKARNSARSANTPVTVVIGTSPSHNTLSFEYPQDGSNATAPSLPPITLPVGVSISCDTAAMTFDPHGMVNTGASIRVSSSPGTDFYATVLLRSPSGRVRTSYGLHAGQSKSS